MTISNPLTYTNQPTECCCCLETTNSYIKFCKCSVKACEDCFHRLIIISDKQLCDSCADTDTQMSYLKLILKCPNCRCIQSSPLTQQVITDLRITDKMMVKKILDFNEEIQNIIEYTEDFSSDDDDYEYTDEYTRRYALTGYAYPRVERDDLINMMLMMNLRHLFNF